MEYNTQRNHLLLPEYGRNIQKMVEYCLTIQDREKRNQYAKFIISAMSSVNPTGKDSPNYFKKLWEHLFIISDYKLDVDSPFEKPKKEVKNDQIQSLHYSNSNIRMRTYGKFNQKMIEKIATMPDGVEKQVLTDRVAHELKKSHLQWNINTCDDDVILKHLEILSNDRLHVSEGFQFRTTKEILGKKPNSQANNNGSKKQNNQQKKQNKNAKKAVTNQKKK
jgi:hypothetical protein